MEDYTINDDLRAQSLQGDDVEGDDAVRAEALFGAGASASSPVDVDASPTTSTASKRRRTRALTSELVRRNLHGGAGAPGEGGLPRRRLRPRAALYGASSGHRRLRLFSRRAALYATDRAQAHTKLGDFAAAAADAARRAELDPAPPCPRAHLRRAHACAKLGQYAAARAAAEAGAALAPGDPRFAQLIKEIDAKAPPPKPAVVVEPVADVTAAAAAEEPVTTTATAMDVVVTVFAKGVAAEHVSVEFGEQTLSLSVEVPGEAAYHLQPRLFGKIVPARCTFAVLSTKIEVRLAKAEPGTTWASLEFNASSKPTTQIVWALQAQRRPSYPSSKGKKDWDKIESEVKKEEKEEKLDGEAASNRFFRDIFGQADEDARRAMTKSFVESNGTVLSMNWKEVGAKTIEPSAPDGLELRKWEY
ncbi:hypothetical protein PR202_gb26496 [Eleusine coracana subsp. coracana]|uniref:Uncharacterized protein n=1 Tax=Eleusine coracana subsp. coracana TaxID=191504 RepID=A0AAV5FSA5_ELECO|nr:hypothetical protein PR202_gb26496 [Eleusine coracana subsp. coracana]